jgi:hypothetical protein
MHRFVWDLHYARPAGVRLGYPISAIPGNTPVEPRGPWALPGDYTVRLTVDGVTQERTLRVAMDPRVQTPQAALRQQFELSMRIRNALDGVAAMESADGDVSRLASDLESLYRDLQASDAAPTPMVVQLTEERLESLARLTGG